MLRAHLLGFSDWCRTIRVPECEKGACFGKWDVLAFRAVCNLCAGCCVVWVWDG